MERFFFKKVELWLVLLLFLLSVIGAMLFGMMVRNEAQGHDRFGRLGDLAFAFASLPATAKGALSFREDHWMSVRNSKRFEGKQGWHFATADTAFRPDGYLLYSRYDGDVDRSVIELVDLKSAAVEHRIVLHSDVLFDDWEPVETNDIATPWIPERFRAVHPLALSNGDVIVKDHYSPLVRITPCGDPVWSNSDLDFHHSLEQGPNGALWVPTAMPLQAFDGLHEDFRNEGLAKVDHLDGNILYVRSIGDLLIENGYEYLIVKSRQRIDLNPMHLNDIQPVFEDGPYWKRGDLFLSFRTPSAIMLFRPATDEILWFKQGPWQAQHDVDIVNDHTIALFNNDAINTGNGPRVREANRITYFDFDTATVGGPHDAALARHEVRTTFGGLFSLLPGGFVMAEETNSGRIVILDRNGDLAVDVVNRASDGKIYFVGWSRFLEREKGDHIRDQMRAVDCPD